MFKFLTYDGQWKEGKMNIIIPIAIKRIAATLMIMIDLFIPIQSSELPNGKIKPVIPNPMTESFVIYISFLKKNDCTNITIIKTATNTSIKATNRFSKA